MASGGGAVCPVCLETFSNPVVLSCGHSICGLTCAPALVRTRSGCGSRLTCPTCRAKHWLPEGVASLRKNYALLEEMESRGGGVVSTGPAPCPTHPGESASLFCTDCHQGACARCCVRLHVAEPEEAEPRHLHHKVIPADRVQAYMQELLTVASKYLATLVGEESAHLSHLLRSEKKIQEAVAGQCRAVQEQTQEVTRLLEAEARRRVRHLTLASDLPHVTDSARSALSRYQQYDTLLRHCTGLLDNQQDASPEAVDNFRSFLSSLDDLPLRDPQSEKACPSPQTPQPAPPPSCPTLEAALEAARRQFQTCTERPSPPELAVDQCLAGRGSLSLQWSLQPSQAVLACLVHYQRALFVHAVNADVTTICVEDFGRSSAHVTIRGLEVGARYRTWVVARNEQGESERSQYLYFKACAEDPDMRLV